MTKKYKKHRFNIFPEMSSESLTVLKNSILDVGYIYNMPITLYQGMVLDGWNRYLACEDIGIDPVVEKFKGNDLDAINYVMLTNKRRNITSSQWACIANEASNIISAIKEVSATERKKKQSKSLSETHKNKKLGVSVKKLPQAGNRVSEKIAKRFNTNRTYVTNAGKLKVASPSIFEQVKNGDLSIKSAMTLAWEKGYISKQDEYKKSSLKKKKQSLDLIVNQENGFIPVRAFISFYVSLEDELKVMNKNASECCKTNIQNILDLMDVKIGNFSIDKRLLVTDDIFKPVKNK